MKNRIGFLLLAAVCFVSLLAAGCGSTLVRPAQGGAGASAAGEIAVHFIDVGQGDAVLIRTPQKAILIDSGDINNGKGEHPVVTYLKKQGLTALDAVIVTHPHADHIGGMREVLDAFTVKQIYDSGQTTTTQIYQQYLRKIKQQKIPFTIARAGDGVDLGDGAVLRFLHPREPLIKGTDSDLNNNSLVTHLVFGGVSFFFAADVEKEAERLLLKQPDILRSTILKVAHHGSSTSSTAAFLKAVAPETAVIMCGHNNDYRHPHAGTLEKIAQLNTKIYRTDLHGSVVITTDGKQYKAEVDKKR